MKVRYDAKRDIAYIRFSRKKPDGTIEIDEGCCLIPPPLTRSSVLKSSTHQAFAGEQSVPTRNHRETLLKRSIRSGLTEAWRRMADPHGLTPVGEDGGRHE
jgi:hypothetical protein